MSATLEEFKSAEQNMDDKERPCLSIPYSDLRSDCCDKGDELNNNCKIVQWSCDGDNDTNNTLVNLKKKGEALNKLIDLLKVVGETYSNSNQDEQVEGVLKGILDLAKQELPNINASIEGLNKELAEKREKLRMRIDFGKRCLENRQSVMKIFADAIALAERESDPEITVIATKMVAVWKQSIVDHEDGIKAVSEGIAKCEEMANRTEPR
ncbi:MAG: hypothetical protein WA869_18940 [Alloacidobacterium sp.]|jgi:hypothetical protein